MNPSPFKIMHLLRVFCLLILCVGAELAVNLSAAAAPTNAPAASGSRYLFIVQTSSSMRKRAENTQAALANLLSSGLNGQLQEGDTIGLWTFDDDLHAGQFPLQRWTAQNGQRIAPLLVDYLRSQFTNLPADSTKVFKPMIDLMHRSEKITVVLVTDGADKLSGTPSDNEINENFNLNFAAQQKARMPFITVLRSKRGAFIGSRVNTPPWPIEFPAFPPEPKPQPVAKVEPVPKVVTPVPVEIPQPVTPAVPAPAPAPPVTTATEPPAVVNIVSNPPAVSVPAVPLTPPAEAPTASSTAPSPVPSREPPKPVVSAPPNTPVWPTPKASSPPPPALPASEPKVTTPPLAPAPAPVVPAENIANPPVVAENSPSTPTALPKVAPAVQPKAAVAQTATVTSPEPSRFKRTNLLIGGIALMVGAGILLFVQMRRPRRMERISLITHAVDREEK